MFTSVLMQSSESVLSMKRVNMKVALSDGTIDCMRRILRENSCVFINSIDDLNNMPNQVSVEKLRKAHPDYSFRGNLKFGLYHEEHISVSAFNSNFCDDCEGVDDSVECDASINMVFSRIFFAAHVVYTFCGNITV